MISLPNWNTQIHKVVFSIGQPYQLHDGYLSQWNTKPTYVSSGFFTNKSMIICHKGLVKYT